MSQRERGGGYYGRGHAGGRRRTREAPSRSPEHVRDSRLAHSGVGVRRGAGLRCDRSRSGPRTRGVGGGGSGGLHLAPAPAATRLPETHLSVSGCGDKTIGDRIVGEYEPYDTNHNKVVFRKLKKTRGHDVFIYYWDDRDGPDQCGWWFGPVVGGNQVWAYHPSRTASSPPATDWNVPHDGAIDHTFTVSALPASGGSGGSRSGAVEEPPRKQARKSEPERDTRAGVVGRVGASARDGRDREVRDVGRGESAVASGGRDNRGGVAASGKEAEAPRSSPARLSTSAGTRAYFVEAYKRRKEAEEAKFREQEDGEEERRRGDDIIRRRPEEGGHADRRRGVALGGREEERGAGRTSRMDQESIDDHAQRRGGDRGRDLHANARRRDDDARGGRHDDHQAFKRRGDIESPQRRRGGRGEEDDIRRRRDDDERGRHEEDDRKRRDEERQRRDDEERRRRDLDEREDRRRRQDRERRLEDEKKAKEEERRRHEDNLERKRQEKRREEEEKRRKDDEIRRKELEEKRREDRKRQEELDAKRAEEERVKAEADKKAREEEAKAMRQQQATLNVLRVLQQLSNANPENFDVLKKELARVMSSELPETGSQEEILKTEASRVLEHAQHYVEQVREQQLREQQQIQEQEKTALELLGELERMVATAESNAESVHYTAAPLAGEHELQYAQVFKIAKTAEEAGNLAIASCSACADFLSQKRAIIDEAERIRAETQGQISLLQPRIKNAAHQATDALRQAKASKERVARKCAAARRMEKQRDLFAKYDQDGDGMLNEKEVFAYAKGEFDFVIPEETFARISRQLLRAGVGVELKGFQRLKTAVGIARDEALGSVRRAAREERERIAKEQAEARQAVVNEKKAEAQKLASEIATAFADRVEPAIQAAEGEAGTLAAEANNMEVETLRAAARSAEAAGRSADLELSDIRARAETLRIKLEETPELVAHLSLDLKRINAVTANGMQRLKKVMSTAEAAHQLAHHWVISEYEGCRMEIAAALHACMEAAGGKVEDLFDAIAEKGAASVSEKDVERYVERNQCSIDREKLARLFRSFGDKEVPATEGLPECDTSGQPQAVNAEGALPAASAVGDGNHNLGGRNGSEFVACEDASKDSAAGAEHLQIAREDSIGDAVIPETVADVTKASSNDAKIENGADAKAHESDARHDSEVAVEQSKAEGGEVKSSGAHESVAAETNLEHQSVENKAEAAVPECREEAPAENATDSVQSQKAEEVVEKAHESDARHDSEVAVEQSKAEGGEVKSSGAHESVAAETNLEHQSVENKAEAAVPECREEAPAENATDSVQSQKAEEVVEKAELTDAANLHANKLENEMPDSQNGFFVVTGAATMEAESSVAAIRIGRDDFSQMIRLLYKVIKEIVLTDNLLIEQSRQIRRMEVGEVMEVTHGPSVDPAIGIYRIGVRALKDGLVGWVTVAGNAGVTFLLPCACIFRAAAPTPLTRELRDVDGTTAFAELREGQILEVLDWARTSRSTLGVTRIKTRFPNGPSGWATVVGNDGMVYTGPA
eukprot:TRINITY_DN917_c0_g1_i5.p1 TRINITY_DN917_c0_g1~~TRINITY_DN917_c0_g1_i5.p1  ORF type:complete len:1531 (-),score=358.95 TRINITY_DN917_c0_g1_i5:103-4695(-)